MAGRACRKSFSDVDLGWLPKESETSRTTEGSNVDWVGRDRVEPFSTGPGRREASADVVCVCVCVSQKAKCKCPKAKSPNMKWTPKHK